MRVGGMMWVPVDAGRPGDSDEERSAMTHETGADGPGTAAPERVELAFPLRPDLVFLARMTAAAVATRADFGFDQVEDLRLAIDELCITVGGEDGAGGRLRLLFEWTEGTIRVEATLDPDDPGEGGTAANGGASAATTASAPATTPAPTTASTPATGGLSERILEALVDEHGTDDAAGARRAWIVVRRTTPA